ncbi:MAG TPA: putative lipid II flippase FtsW [Actinomycetota bacterium]|nr:putative lipid II flippase FtsW [Actinomycetota bacterium]
MTTRAMSLAAASRAARASAARNSNVFLLTLCTSALLLLGLIMILSASSVSSFATYGSSFLFFKKQLAWAALGLIGFIGFSRMDYRRLRGWGYPAILIALGLLVAVLIPGFGVMVGGSSRWISLGPISFQPSELAKLALILFAAEVFARKKEKTLKIRAHAFLPLVPALAALALLVMLQPDLGTTVLLGAIGLGMLFVAGAPFRHVGLIGVSGVVLAAVAALSEPYRRARILAFRDPWADPLNTGYQTIQSLIALGSGGWWGVGLGGSRQKWLYVPNAHTDFIFAILGEEMGLIGTLVVLGLFAFITYLGFGIARDAPDRFGLLVASGITIAIACQTLVNIGAVTGALPITGVPLPLVSFGGTSLVVTLCAIGILTSIGRAGRSGRAPAHRDAATK